MKKLLFIFLFLAQISIIRTMNPGQSTSSSSSNQNPSISYKIMKTLLWPFDAFSDWNDYMRNEWKPGFDLSTLFVGLAGMWGIYAGISLIYLYSVIGSQLRKGQPDENGKAVRAFLQRVDHSKFQKFMNRIFINPFNRPIKQ